MNRFAMSVGGLFAAMAVPSAALALNGISSVPFQGAAPADFSNSGGAIADTPGFNIILNYGSSTPTAGEAAAFAAAEAQWESWITGYRSNDIANTNVNINVTLGNIDGPGGVLGSAGPTNGKLNAAQNAVTSTWLYTQLGVMQFDTSDTAALVSNGSFGAVILHEMGHVLGIGSLWSSSGAGIGGRQELYANNSGQYTGAFGLAAYNAEFGQSGTNVPVELAGGPGTANGHWDEVTGGFGLTGRVSNLTGQDFAFELMTGWLNPPTFTSQLTIQGMQDLGYTVVPEPATGALLALGAAAMTMRRRRRAC